MFAFFVYKKPVDWYVRGSMFDTKEMYFRI